MAPFRKKAATILAEAQQELLDTNAKLSDTGRRRDQLLLANDATGLDAIEIELANLQKAAVRQADRIRLLEQEAEREEAARRVRAHEGLITRVEGKLRAREEAGREVANLVAKLESAYRKLISMSEEIAPAWPWSAVDRNVIMTTGTTIQIQLAHEFFRVSHKPFLGGTPGARVEVSLPGSKCSRPVDWLGFPEREPALVAVLKAASDHASKLMRSGKVAQSESLPPDTSTADETVSPGPVRTTDQERLAKLLKRQSELSEDFTPEGEAPYKQVVAEIAALS